MVSIQYQNKPDYANTTLQYTPLSVPMNFADRAVNNLTVLIKYPRRSKRKYKWLRWVGGLQGSRPVRKEYRPKPWPVQYSAEVYALPEDTLIGVGLLFCEGWIFSRILWTTVVIVISSLLFSVGWSVGRSIGEGFAVGSYMFAASMGFVSLVGLVSTLESTA